MAVTTSSIVAFKFADGIITATDMHGAYGGLSKFTELQRTFKLSDSTLLSFSGKYADIEFLYRALRHELLRDNLPICPPTVFQILQRILYHQRSQLTPVNVNCVVLGIGSSSGGDFSPNVFDLSNVLEPNSSDPNSSLNDNLAKNPLANGGSQERVGGISVDPSNQLNTPLGAHNMVSDKDKEKNSPGSQSQTELQKNGTGLDLQSTNGLFLRCVNERGNFFDSEVICTGLGAHFVTPYLRSKVIGKHLTKDDAIEICQEAMRMLAYRDCTASNKIQIGLVQKNFCEVSNPLVLEQAWQDLRTLQ